MAGMRKYDNLLYKDYEELSNKLDKVLTQLSDIQTEHKIEIKQIKKDNKKLVDELKDTIDDLKKELSKVNELNKKLIEENEKLKNQNNKNSSNSSKPSSTDMFKQKKKTGPNLYNSRIKSSKKAGGQPNHKGYNLSKESIEQKISEGYKVITHYHKISGDSKKEPLKKYIIGLII